MTTPELKIWAANRLVGMTPPRNSILGAGAHSGDPHRYRTRKVGSKRGRGRKSRPRRSNRARAEGAY